MKPEIDLSLKVQRLSALRDFVQQLPASHTFALAAFLMSLKGKTETTLDNEVICQWHMGWDYIDARPVLSYQRADGEVYQGDTPHIIDFYPLLKRISHLPDSSYYRSGDAIRVYFGVNAREMNPLFYGKPLAGVLLKRLQSYLEDLSANTSAIVD
jgi:hypothetical protein